MQYVLAHKLLVQKWLYTLLKLRIQMKLSQLTIHIYCQCIRSLPCGSKTHLGGYTGWLMGNGLRKIAWCYHREDKGHHSCRSCRHSLWLWQDILSSWKQEIFITCKEWNSKSNRQSDCYDWYISCICSNMVQKASRKLHGFFQALVYSVTKVPLALATRKWLK